MTTLAELSAQTEAARTAALRDRDAAVRAIHAVLDAAKQNNRTRLTPTEDVEVERLLAQRASAIEAASKAATQLEEIDIVLTEETEIRGLSSRAAGSANTAARPAYDRVARVGAEERTYRPDRDRTGKAFLLDVSRSALFSDVGSTQRLGRHMDEEHVERGDILTRAVGTGAFTGLTVPQYLTDMYAPATAALRPIADICNPHDLPPEGMTVNISRITTATGVALQATENTAVQNTDIDDTLLTINVQTAAGQQTVSRQAIERGTGIEDVTLQDLFRRYATNLDGTIIGQAATGLAAVAQGTTYTSAAPTAAEFWPYLFQVQSKLEAALLGQALPNYIAMHSRRWNWLCSQVGTSFPFVGAAGTGLQSGGVIVTNQYGDGVRGVLSNGMRVIVDNNLSTVVGGTQDEVYVVASGECHLWEDPNAPMLIRAEQPAAASLGVLLVVYGYFAYTASRYANNPGRITGTGLAAPAGF